MSAACVTVGRGENKAKGRDHALSANDPVASLIETIKHLEGEDWISFARFESSYRSEKNWRSSAAIGVDADYLDSSGEHAEMPGEVVVRVDRLFESSTCPGTIAHRTRRGLRIVFVLDDCATDHAAVKRAHDGAVRAVAAALRDAEILGERDALKVDTAASTDLARLWWGRRGDFPIVQLRDDLYAVDEIASHASTIPQRSRTISATNARSTQLSIGFDEARARWLTDHPRDWPRAGGACPMCGHKDCFGQLDGDDARWACFSANHGSDSGGIGVEGSKCWHGDALDVEVYRRGLSQAGLLKADGYLDTSPSRARTTRDATPAGDSAPWGSDEALALAFAERYSDRFRFSPQEATWREWDGARWKRDESLHHFTEARALVRETARSATDESDAKRLASAKSVGATVQLARSDSRLVVAGDVFDSNEWLLNTPGGTVDLKTGELRPARREDLLTMRTAVAPSGDCPRWRAALSDWTGGDLELQLFLQRMAGYAITGSTREHALFFFWGLGGNGKSVFVKTLAAALGDYARTAPIETFTESAHDRHPTELAMLRGARLVESQETEEGRAWAEAKLKRLTGGDRIAARFMRGDFFEYTPIFKLFVFGNHKPRLRNVDAAMKRRLHMIPFNVPVSEEKKDKMLTERLRAEWSGILRWAVDGALEWQRIGLSPPLAVTDASSTYFEGEDLFAQWLEDACLKDTSPHGWEPTSGLVASYAAWASERESRPLSQKALIEKLEAQGFRRGKRFGGKRGVEGLRLKRSAVAERESQEGSREKQEAYFDN